MAQRLILFKTLPSDGYLDQLIRDGVLRAGMTFLPGSCYAGAGIYPETSAYVSTMSTSGTAGSACPDPSDIVACEEWQVFDFLHKASFGFPQPYNAFVFLEVRAGFRGRWEKHVEETYRSLEVEAQQDAGSEYFAAAHLIGCGSYNALFEFLTPDHDRLQRAILQLTDEEYVLDVMVGHLAADDAKGFGDPGARAAAP